MGREHSVPLSDRALEILDALHAARGRDRRLVFPGARPGRPISRNTVYDQCERVTAERASP